MPPSEDKEQFKDGVLWADCVTLLQTDDVFLITNDRAFYKERDPKQGLAPALAAEISGANHKLTLLEKLTDLLSEIKDGVVVDDIMLARSFLVSQKKSIIDIVTRHDFEMGEIIVVQRRLFATENPRHLFVRFTIEYECSDVTATRGSAVLKVEGECRYDVDNKTFDQFVTRGEELRFHMPDGTHVEHDFMMIGVDLFIGHKNIENITRVELE